MSAAPRRYIERLVARRVITDAIAAGYAISVNDGEEFTIERSTDARRIFAAMCSTDEDFLHLHRHSLKVDGRPASETVWHRKPFAWIKLVYGNDGVDLVSDYTTNLEALIKPIYDWIAADIDRTEWNIQPLPAAPVITGRTFTRTVWTLTTEGNNRGITTDVHASEADCEAAVRAELRDHCKPSQCASLDTLAGDALREAWEETMDGACIITPHNIEVEA